MSSSPFNQHRPAVNFIDNRMEAYHPAFKRGNCIYDRNLDQYVWDTSQPSFQLSPGLRPPGVMATPPPGTMTTPPPRPMSRGLIAVDPGFSPSMNRLSPLSRPLSRGISDTNIGFSRPTTPATPQPRPKPKSIEDMDFLVVVFPKAMKRFDGTAQKKQRSSKQDWCIRKCGSWSDVQERLLKAKDHYHMEHKAHFVQISYKAVRRALDSSAMPVKQALGLVPDMDIVSPIKNVMKLLLDAHAQSKKTRENVAEGFNDLPDLFAGIERYSEWFPGDDNIFEASVNFLFATLQAIEEAIRFYTSNPVTRLSHAVFKGDEYEKILSDSIENMEVQAKQLEKQAAVSFDHQSLSHQKHMSQSSAKMESQVSDLGQQNQYCIGLVENLHNWVLQLLDEKAKNPPQFPPPRPITPIPNEPVAWSPRDLYRKLQLPNIDEAHMMKACNNIADITYAQRNRAEQVVATPEFRAWFTYRCSTRLLVHGDFGCTGQTSPLSIVCATVVQGLRASRAHQTVSLVFFCGYNMQRNAYCGGVGMIISLIAQLLYQFPAPTVRIDPARVEDTIRNGSAQELCRLFAHLIRLLPPRTAVFCLIDGIQEYEKRDYLESMADVVLALQDLVDGGSAAEFKLLLTSPNPTMYVKTGFSVAARNLLNMQGMPFVEGGSFLPVFPG